MLSLDDDASTGVPKRVWSATGLQVAGRLFGSLCTFATLGILSRHLELADFGRFTFYLAAFALLDAWADFGVGQVVVQRTAAEPQRTPAVLVTARRARLLLAGIGSLGVALMAFAFDEPGAIWIALAALYPLTHALELTTVVFTNRIAWSRPVALRALGVAIRFAGVLALFASGERRPAPYLLVTAAGSALGNLLLHLGGRRELRGDRDHPPALLDVLRAAAPLGVASLCQQAYFYVDNLFIRAHGSDEALGVYNASVRLMSFAIMVPLYAALAALPWMRREHASERLTQAADKLALPLVGVAVVTALLCAPFAGPILQLVFGAGFESGAPALLWLIAAVVAVHAGAVYVTALVAAARGATVLRISAAALALNVVGNAAFVPSYGIVGAAATTFATEILVAGLAYRATRILGSDA